MKLYTWFLLATVAADESSDDPRAVRPACEKLMQEKLEEYPVVRGKWECSEYRNNNRMKCRVDCNGAGIIREFQSGYRGWKSVYPYLISSKCSSKKHVREIRFWGNKKWLINPIECVDLQLGSCRGKAEEVKSRQTGNGSWNCRMNERANQYACAYHSICPSGFMKPKPENNSRGFYFTQCHTEEPVLNFYGMNDGEEFKCSTCDEEFDLISAQVEYGTFVRKHPDRPDSSYEGDWRFYHLKCNDESIKARYKCSNSGVITKTSKKATTWEDQPCAEY